MINTSSSQDSLQVGGSAFSGDCLLRISDVRKRVGLSRSQIYKLASEGKFPRQIRLGLRASGWLESEIEEWIAQRVCESRKEVA